MYTVNEVAGDKGLLDVAVKFNDGRVYRLLFCNTNFLQSKLAKGYFAVPGLIAIDVVSMERVKQVIHPIFKSGYFNGLVPESGGG